MDRIENLDIVALLKNLPEENLKRGDIGTIVEILDENNFLVEFSDSNGRTVKMAEMESSILMKLNFKFEPEYA